MRSELIYKHIGLLIRNRRKQLGWTQQKLASQLVISRASLASIETGRQNVLVHQLYALSTALELAVSDFLPAPTDLISKYDSKTLPLPEGLNAQQKEQIARLLMNGTEIEAKTYGGDSNEHKAKARSKKAGTRGS